MLKLAIVGTGIIMKSHVTAINQLDDVELVAVCDVNEEKAKRYSEQCGVPYVLDYKELPSKIDFDAVLLNLRGNGVVGHFQLRLRRVSGRF